MTEARRRRSHLAAVVGSVAIFLASTGVVAAAEFPRGYEGYHSYAEVAAATKAVADARPDIARRLIIGYSNAGRHIYAMKISDNVTTDESEPEVVYDGGHHADEHMGVEMTLRIMRWLVDGYGTDPRITSIVNSREIYIVFLVNPDGAEYDIAGGRFHWWRKNRQPTPGTGYIGTDLNRNYGYRWGGGGRTSTNPAAITYRGPAAWSAPETRAMRDFFASRVVNGRQQIRAHITFHETGRLVMWPYGYTYANIPADMTSADYYAFVHMGRAMAASNGYRPQQASDLYVTSGTTRDYLYGTYRVFSYTFELSNDDYMDDSLIASETGRNRNAVLYLAERAWCPYAVLGASYVDWRCGAFDDDFEAARGWVIDPDDSDTSTSGAFTRGDPQPTSSSGAKQLGTAPSGARTLTTGLAAGSSAGANDLDGRSTVRSPSFRLFAHTGQRLYFRYAFAHGADATAADRLVAYIETSDGTRNPVFTRTATGADVDGAWRSLYIPLDTWRGQAVRIVFLAEDAAGDSLVEAQIDDVRVTRGT